MAGINILKSDVDFARNFLVQYLTDAGYEGSLEDGTALNDLLIKAFALMFTLFRFEADKSSAYMSVKRAKQLQVLLGNEYDAAIDALLSNWFVSRGSGAPTTGTLRLVFIQPPDYFALNAGTTVCTINNFPFTPSQDYVFTSSDFVAVANTSQNTVEYYVDILVQSTYNLTTAITAGTSSTAAISDIYFLRADVPAAFTSGAYKETSDEFIARTEKAITTRELITPRAIATVLPANYSDVKGLYVAGFGTQEQLRDTATYDSIVVHVGNKADIYVRSQLVKRTFTAPVLNGGVLDLTGMGDHIVDALGVASIPTVLVPTVTNYTYTLAITPVVPMTAETSYGTVGVTPTITASAAPVGTPVTLTYLTHSVLPKVNAFVNSSAQRVSCYDPKVKSMFPILVSMNFAITLSGGTLDSVSKAVKDIILKYFASIPMGAPIILSEMIAAVHAAVPMVGGIKLPMTVTYKYRDPATLSYITGTIVDEFDFPALPGSFQLSWNTIQFYTDADLINISLPA